jgi:putative heme-binding domain-containing protein
LQASDVVPLLTSSDQALRETAFWIVSRHPEWGEHLVKSFGKLFAEGFTDARVDQLATLLARLAKSPKIQELVGALPRTEVARPMESAARIRQVYLRAMAGAGLKEAPPSWCGALAALLSRPDSDLKRQVVATVRSLSLPKQGFPLLTQALRAVGSDVALPPAVRLDALTACGPLSLEPELFDFLCDHLAGSKPMLTRSAAATVLAKAELTPEQQDALAGLMKNVGPLEAPKLLPAFEKSPTEALGLKLVAALKQSAGLRGLRVDLVKPLLAKYPQPVQQAGEEVLTLLNEDAAKQKAHLEDLAVDLKSGDIRRGQAIFNSPKAACFTCHALGYLGGKVGPDLTSIGQIRSERDLLEAIVYPSASFVRSYEPMIVVTKSGEEFSGVLRRDSSDEVVLATGAETEARIARADIVEMRPGAVSVMPTGLDEQLTRQELADLVTFLKGTKWGAQ